MDDQVNKKGVAKWLLGIVGVLLVLSLGAILWTSHWYERNIYQDSQATETATAKEGTEPFAVLIEGLDSGAWFYKNADTTRSDVMIVATVNPKTKESTMLSIPRDTLAVINNDNEFAKINEAYMEGGIDQSISAIEQFIDVPIDYYVTVNMQAFLDIIDGLGGITVTPKLTFDQDGSHFKANTEMKLNGKDALNYVRMRKQDPRGDLGRNERQQEVVRAVIKRAMTINSVSELKKVLDTVSDNVKTNLAIDQLIANKDTYIEAAKHLTPLTIDTYQDVNHNNQAFVLWSEQERVALSNQLRHSLGMPPTDSVLLYPASFGIYNKDYETTEDLNHDGKLTDSDMVLAPGRYSLDDLFQAYSNYGLTPNVDWRDYPSDGVADTGADDDTDKYGDAN